MSFPSLLSFNLNYVVLDQKIPQNTKTPQITIKKIDSIQTLHANNLKNQKNP
jgi:hypothetical protein